MIKRRIKYILFIFVISIIFFCINGFSCYGNIVDKEFTKVNVKAACVIDSESGRVLFGKNEDTKLPMASLTKVMTSIMLVENCDMDELIEVPGDATWIGGSEVGLKKGDKVTARALLYGMLLPSGNDCAYTVAIHLGGTIENFARMMNNKAKDIGLENTHFANPHGLDNDEHYTTAKEMALITKYAIQNKNISEAMNTRSTTINFGSFSKLLNNTNALLKTYEYADGGKTGFTNNANRCLVATATKNDLRLIAVVLGAETTQIRFNSAKELLEASFARYKKMDVSKNLNFYVSVPVIKGSIDKYERKFIDNLTLPLADEEYENITIKQDIVQSINAPVMIGEYLGKIEAYIEDEKIYELEIRADQNIYKKTFLDYLKEEFKVCFKSFERL